METKDLEMMGWSRGLWLSFSCFIFILKETFPLPPGPLGAWKKTLDLPSVCAQVSHRQRRSFLVPTLADSSWLSSEQVATISSKNCSESTELHSTDVASGIWRVPEGSRVQCPDKEVASGSMAESVPSRALNPVGFVCIHHHKLMTAAVKAILQD